MGEQMLMEFYTLKPSHYGEIIHLPLLSSFFGLLEFSPIWKIIWSLELGYWDLCLNTIIYIIRSLSKPNH
jgi:hypothetical protein